MAEGSPLRGRVRSTPGVKELVRGGVRLTLVPMSEANNDRRADIARRLNTLLDKAERGGFRRLTVSEITDLGTHYRAVTTHLSQARTSGQSMQTIRSLNALTARAHGVSGAVTTLVTGCVATLSRRSPSDSMSRSSVGVVRRAE